MFAILHYKYDRQAQSCVKRIDSLATSVSCCKDGAKAPHL